MKLILLGAPGAGKGTQSEVLGRKYGIPTISTGNILRTAMKNETPVGLKAKEYVESGKLVPDDIIIGIIKERLSEDDCRKGYILDGVPRTIGQADALEQFGVEIDCAISIEISDEEIVFRMAGRRMCPDCGATFHIANNPPRTQGECDQCGAGLIIRNDDAPETLKARLLTYHQETEPLKKYYEKRGTLRSVKNQSTIEGTTAEIVKALGL